MKLEKDVVEIMGGVRHGLTLGSPDRRHHPQHGMAPLESEMSPDPGQAERPPHHPSARSC